jgi:hypothetical protein
MKQFAAVRNLDQTHYNTLKKMTAFLIKKTVIYIYLTAKKGWNLMFLLFLKAVDSISSYLKHREGFLCRISMISHYRLHFLQDELL